MSFLFLKTFIPEIFLSFFILFQLVYNAYLINNVENRLAIIVTETVSQTLFLLIIILFLLINLKYDFSIFNFLFLNNLGTQHIKILFIIVCIFVLIILFNSFKLQNLNFFEYFTLYLLIILSLLLLISANDFLSAYLVIELQALCFYVLAGFNRMSAFSTEAGLKYFIVGSFISGIFLAGCCIIYGILGTLNLFEINLLLILSTENENLKNYLYVGFLLVVMAFLFKLTIAPFHFWAPDVYEGAPLSSTIIFSIIPKISLLFFLLKILLIIQNFFTFFFINFEILGILSVLFGVIFAIRQKRLKRLIIYSSIGQMGFVIIALANLNLISIINIYIFIIIYIISSLIFWSLLSMLYTFQKQQNIFNSTSSFSLYLVALSNFFKQNIFWAFSFFILFFSLAGLPPLSGFLAKFFIIFTVLDNINFSLIITLILLSVISAFYYLRNIKIIFFEPKQQSLKALKFQVIFLTSDLYINLICLSSFLLILILWFFDPIYLFLYCYKFSLNFYAI